MNRQSLIEYKLYQMILEADLSDEERQALSEANIFQRFRDWFGAVKDWTDSPLGSLFSDAKLGRRLQTSLGNVKKEIEQLKGIAREGNRDERQVIADFINAIAKGENISTSDLTKSAGGQSAKTGNIPSEELPPGTKVTTTDPQILLSALAQLLANVTGKPLETVAQQANEKKADATTMTSVVAKQASQKTGVDAKIVQNVVNALIKTGHFVMERATKHASDSILIERWQRLAGVELNEAPKEPDYSMNYIIKRIETGEIKRIADIPDVIKKAKIKKLSPDQFEKVIDAFEKKKAINPAEGEAAKQELETAMEKLPEVPTGQGAKEVSPQDAEKAETALKKFAAAADSVRKEVKDIDDTTLGTILNYFDELENIKIA